MTTTTTYRYNADGALTAFTKKSPSGSETTYLTWDDFTPDSDDPTTGTVRIGNGTLDGYGPSPGVTSATFQFDARDRLIGYSDDSATQSYEYYADGLLASASSGGDDLRFYFDKATNAGVQNIHHLASNEWSAYLDRVRYLSDGTEQVLMMPRKDTAALYTPAEEGLQSYAYDPFGAQSQATLSKTYDLKASPFQYAGEYRDPMWGGYYLRARWYHPDLATFISRDPTEQLNRYYYGGGNPVNTVDPGGTGFFQSLGRGLAEASAALNRGIGGHFARFFLAPLMGPLQIAADPEGFWQAVKHNRAGMDVFLGVGVVSEFLGGVGDLYAVTQGIGISMARRFLARAASDMVIGFGQSVAAGADRGFKHFDWNAFVAGAEMTIGTIGIWRGVGSLNIRSGYRLSGLRAGAMARNLADEADGTAMVFRVKTKIPAPIRPRISPLQEWAGWGGYHERLIAVTKSDFYATDFVDAGVAREYARFGSYSQHGPASMLEQEQGKLEYVGKVANFNHNQFLANPRMLRFRSEDMLNGYGEPNNPKEYGFATNNCHHHAFAILESLGLRRSLRSYFGFR
jgi:RHS repeat-associated protein